MLCFVCKSFCMKLTRLLCLALVLLGLNAEAETTVQIGTGTSTGYDKGPWHQLQSNNRSRKLMVFTEAELADAGILPGKVIHAMKWRKVTNAVLANGATATGKLYMRAANYPNGYGTGTVNVVDYTGNGFLQVSTVHYNSTDSNIAVADWVGFTDLYYTYTGGDLEIYVDWQMVQGVSEFTTTGYFSWQCTNLTEYMCMAYYGVPNSNSTFSVDYSRPNTLFVFDTLAACSTAPVAGTSVSDAPGALCAGENFGLTLTGNTVSPDLDYTWQSGPTASGPWVNYSVPLEQPLIGITATGVTTWYRCKVKCGNMESFSTPVEVVASPGLAGGTYTINNAQPTGNGNYTSFHDAIQALGCGVAGAVTFNVVAGSGPYVEQIVIPQIGGASILSPITINGNGATLKHTLYGPGAERATLKLDGADYITINDLDIEVYGGDTSDFGYGVQIIHSANLNTIKNCNVSVHQPLNTANANTYAGVVINGHAQDLTGGEYAFCNLNNISNNTITGGYYGVVLMGDNEANTITGNILSKNTIKDFYACGIYAGNNSIAIIEGNDISRPSRYDDNEGDFTGIKLAGYNASTFVVGNKIHDAFGSMQGTVHSATAIAVEGCNPGEGSEVVFANNVMYGFRSRGSQYGISASGSSYVKFQHNTIDLRYEDATCDYCGVYGFYQGGAVVNKLDFSNNIFSINGVGEGQSAAMYFTNGINNSTFVNNDYYIAPNIASTGAIGYINGQKYSNLIFWKVGVLGDLLSISEDPQYQDPLSGRMSPTNTDMDNKGFQVGILLDINGDLRNLTTPDMGAYEFDENTLAIRNTEVAKSPVGIYPNPATDVVNVNFKEKVNITVSSIDGRVLVAADNTNQVNMANLATGLYILKVTDREGSLLATEKILKQDK